MEKLTAAYVRVSELKQHAINQIPDIEADIKKNNDILYKHKCKNIEEWDKRAQKMIETATDEQDKKERMEEMQKLREYLKQGYFVEIGQSGRKEKRPELLELMELAAQKQFNQVETWAIDRFTRQGANELLIYVKKLEKDGVSFKSMKEPIIDTSGPLRDAIIAIFGALANMESIRQGDRVRAGIKRVRLKGKKWGMEHEYPDEILQKMKELYEASYPYYRINKIIKEQYKQDIKPASVRYMAIHRKWQRQPQLNPGCQAEPPSSAQSQSIPESPAPPSP
jgi:DNA invertase Pin-like site-specific DNA recombinase